MRKTTTTACVLSLVVGVTVGAVSAPHFQSTGLTWTIFTPNTVAKASEINANFQILQAQITALTSRKVADLVYKDKQTIQLPSSTLLIDGKIYKQDGITELTLDATGIDLGTPPEGDSWYAIYAIPDTGEQYRLVASKRMPAQGGPQDPAEPTRVVPHKYLGVVRLGNNATNGGDLIRFVQVGPRFYLYGEDRGQVAGGIQLVARQFQAAGLVEYKFKVGMTGDELPFDRTAYRVWGHDGEPGSLGASLELYDATRVANPQERLHFHILGSGANRRPEGHIWQLLDLSTVNVVRLWSEGALAPTQAFRSIGISGWLDPIVAGGR